jgi:hypothetical protein
MLTHHSPNDGFNPDIGFLSGYIGEAVHTALEGAGGKTWRS